jgi:capsular polysaccharide biosynthesis protein
VTSHSSLRSRVGAIPVLGTVGRKVLRRTRRTRAERVARRAPSPLTPYDSLLPAGRDRRVVILTDAVVRKKVQPYLWQFRQDRISVLSAEAAPEWRAANVDFEHLALGDVAQYEAYFARLGPVDIIIDLLRAPFTVHQQAWEALFYHLKPGGAYVLDRRLVSEPADGEVLAWLKRIGDLVNRAPDAKRSEPAEATSSIVLTPQLVVASKRHRHYLKLRDANVSELLVAREPTFRVTELQTLPPGELVSRAQVISHDAGVPIPWLPETMPYPPMHLRHYAGRIGYLGSSLVSTETTILPDSFRWHLEPNPRNPKLKSVSPTMARIPENFLPKRTLDGTYFHMDPNGVGHFGHFMTESIGRLWGWDEAKRRYPHLKALYRIRDIKKVNDRFERQLMMAYGIAADDIVAVDKSVYVESLVSATTMWHNAVPHYVHPDLAAVWDRISRNLVAPDAPAYERVFISRSGQWWRRVCRNLPDVEKFFEARGFQIVYPEHLDLPTQAGIFANASVVAGFVGSAMFNVMHAKNLKALVLLAHEAYTARNEHLYTSLIGCPVHYFWSEPDISHPVDGWSQAAFDSDWEFDFARNTRDLEELLKVL